MALRFRTLDFRTIDGSNNNLADSTMNQADTDFARVGPAHFANGFNEMTSGPNPREISNIVVAQEDAGEDGPHLTDDNGVALSGMMYAWGQFIDHDLDLQKSATTTVDPRITEEFAGAAYRFRHSIVSDEISH